MFALKKDWMTPTEAGSRLDFPSYLELRDQVEREVQRSIASSKAASGLKVEEVRFVLEEKDYSRIKGLVRDLAVVKTDGAKPRGNDSTVERLQPMLVYHSTQNVNKVNSILRYGYILPGRKHPTKGWTLRMQNGNLHGDGIYCSPHFDISSWYSFVDFDRAIQLIVNILIPGDTIIFDAKARSSSVWLDRDRGMNVYLQYWEGPNEPLVHDDMNGWVSDVTETYCHTLRTRDMSIWVTGSPERIVPVALVTLRPSTRGAMLKRYEDLRNRRNPFMTATKEVLTLYHFGSEIYLSHRPSAFALLLRALLQSEPPIQLAKSPWHVLSTPEEELSDLLGDKVQIILQLSRNLVDKFDGIVPLDRQDLRTLLGDEASSRFCQWSIPNPSPAVLRHTIIIPTGLFANAVFARSVANFTNSLEHGEKRLALYGKKELQVISVTNDHSVLLAHSKVPSSQPKSVYLLQPLGKLVDEITECNDNEKFVNVLYLFIQQEPDDMHTLDDFVERWKVYIGMKNIMVKLVFLDGVHQQVCLLKSHMQTMYSYSCNFFHSPKQGDLDNTLGILYDEVEQECLFTDSVDVRIPFPYGVAGEGFLQNVTLQPKWDVSIHQDVLFRGCPPEYLLLGGTYYRTAVCEAPDEVALEGFYRCVCRLLASFQAFMFKSPERIRIYGRLIEDLAVKLLNHIDEKQSTERAPPSMLKGMKYQLSGFLSSMNTFGNLTFGGKWYQNLMQMKFGKKIARRVSEDFTISDVKNPRVKEPSDYLSLVARPGRLIRVRTTSASEIEPWLAIVDYVSFDYGNTVEMYIASEKGEKVKDSRGRVVTDVLLWKVEDDNLAKMYHGYVFTRTPYLYMPSQHPSLIVNSMMACIEMAFRQCFDFAQSPHAASTNGSESLPTELVEEVEKYLELAFSFVPRVQSLMRTKPMLEILEGATIEEHVEMYFTESVGVQSVNQVLGLLMLPEAASLTTSIRWPRICFGLLAETVMRNCRAKVRSGKFSAEQLMDRALFIKPTTDVHNYRRNIKRSSQMTNSFMLHSYTNCSPFKTVGVLSFVKLLHNQAKADDIARAFLDGTSSMSSFLHENLPGFGGYITQLALYLQGMNCMKAKLRYNTSFANPKQIVEDIIQRRLQYHEIERLKKSKSMHRNERRRLLQLAQAETYRQCHTHPTLFTQIEVDRLNRDRPTDDQIELMPSGLLVHHCCYPQCPQYLQNLQTRTDRRRGTRHGLMNHLFPDKLLGNYAEDWHVNCRRLIVENQIGLEAFVLKMKRLYPNDLTCEAVARVQYRQYKDLQRRMKGDASQYG